MPRNLLIAAVIGALTCATPWPATAQAVDRAHTIVIVVGALASQPIPTLVHDRWNQDAADLLFLRLARLGPTMVTAGDKGFEPQLAKSWSRQDSLTLIFNLDPRARWHDGHPVTAKDVVFTFGLFRDPKIDPQHSLLLRSVASVNAEGDHRVIIRFTHYYPEQLYDATYQVQPLPAHLVDTIPPNLLGSSDFARHPIGNGPFVWDSLAPAEKLTLDANPNYFLGAPAIRRVIFLKANDPDVQVNMLLSGTADAIENVAPVSNIPRFASMPDLRIVQVPSFTIGYLLFNQRDRKDRSKPHSILSDSLVRRALLLGLDRPAMLRSALGAMGSVPYGPVPLISWIRDPDSPPARYDTTQARALLASRGWTDHDGDGVVDRDGKPLELELNVPTTSGVRMQLALETQQFLSHIGVRIILRTSDGPTWNSRRNQHDFDIDASSSGLDPSPSGLMQSWSCLGLDGVNVGAACDPRVDSLMERAIAAKGDPRPLWFAAIRRLEDDAPAAFMYSLTNAFVVNRRFEHVNIRPDGWWAALGEWTVNEKR